MIEFVNVCEFTSLLKSSTRAADHRPPFEVALQSSSPAGKEAYLARYISHLEGESPKPGI